MAEKVYLKESNVTVTNARFVVSDQTYAMSGITSVKAAEKKPNVAPALIVGGLGVFMLFSGAVEAKIIGLFLIGLAIAWMLQVKHIVVLSSASGEVKAISSRYSDFIERIVAALNEAIIDIAAGESQNTMVRDQNFAQQSVKDTTQVIAPVVSEVCPYCNNDIAKSDTFCSNCGRQIFRPLQEKT